MKKNNRIRMMSHSALIAALYVVLTYLSSVIGLSSGVIQCRVSEALCILPVFTPYAIPGLFVGCIVSNLLFSQPVMILDVIFGSLATLIGAGGTYYMSKHRMFPCLYTLPTILSNTLIIPFVLKFAYGFEGSVFYFMATVGLGEIISCGVLGTVLYYSLYKHSKLIFG